MKFYIDTLKDMGLGNRIQELNSVILNKSKSEMRHKIEEIIKKYKKKKKKNLEFYYESSS